MSRNDIRWIQRFSNFSKALAQLSEFITKGELNKFEEQGLIQSFEYNYELSWNVIKDFFEEQGEQSILGSKDAIRLAFRRGLIENGDVWMKMVKSRVLTSHTYNESTAKEVVCSIIHDFFPAFQAFSETMTKIYNERSSE